MADKKMVHIVKPVAMFGHRPDDAAIAIMKESLDSCLRISKKWPRVRFVIQHIERQCPEQGAVCEFIISAGPEGVSAIYGDDPSILRRSFELEPLGEYEPDNWPFTDADAPCTACGGNVSYGMNEHRKIGIEMGKSDPGHLCRECWPKPAAAAA